VSAPGKAAADPADASRIDFAAVHRAEAMRRREFIALVGGAAGTLASRAFAQSTESAPHLAIVHPSIKISQLSLTGDPNWQIFFRQLALSGYLEGNNLIVDRYSALGRTETFPELAREVVRNKPSVIFALGVRIVQAVTSVTKAIPIVASLSDPVELGFAASLAHPGGNVTGVTWNVGSLWGKRVGILKDAVPSISRVGCLASADVWASEYMTPVREAIARAKLSLVKTPVESPLSEYEYRRTFALMREQRVQGLVVHDQAETYTSIRLITDLANEAKVPTIYPWREFVAAGGLMAYSIDISELARLHADQVSQILGGSSPSEMPIHLATKFILAINLRTAAAFGLTFPPTLLALADEVIE
jgi:putative ABC transport system substrate-binding protein